MAEAKLSDAVFQVEVPNHELLKLAYDSYLAANRQVSACLLYTSDAADE